MRPIQPGIPAPVPPLASFVTFGLLPEAGPGPSLRRLVQSVDPAQSVVGRGRASVLALGRDVPGLRDFPGGTGKGLEIPATHGALWCWLRGEDRGELVHRTRAIEAAVGPAYRLVDIVEGFRHGEGRDLTGYEDGTENPTGAKAPEAAAAGGPAGLQGGSFVAVQQWQSWPASTR